MKKFYYLILAVVFFGVIYSIFDDELHNIDVTEKVASQLSNEQLTKAGDQNNQPVDAKFKPHLDIENHTSKANNIEDVKSSLKNAANRTINQTKIQQTKPRLAQRKLDQLNKLDEKFSSTKATNYTVNNAGQLSGIYPNYTQTFADADQFVEESRDLLDVNTHSTLTKIEDDCTSAEQCISRYKRNAFGFPILQDDFVVSLNNGYVVSVMGAMSLPNVNQEHLKSSNTLTNADIEFMLKNEFGEQYALEGEVVYGIYDAKVVAVPAYQASVSSGFEGYDVIINARNQQVVTKVPHVMHVNAEGQDLQGNTYQFKSVQSDSSYVMQDDRFPLNSYTAIYTMQDLTRDEWLADPFFSFIQSNSLTSGWDPSAVSVLSHFDSLVTYFNENLNYQVKVPGNSPMTIFVNVNEENAFALTNTMGFGKTATSNFANSRDVVAHELTHTIISATSNLVYSDQSGAMNESFADLFGTLASDDGNWLLGEDIYDDGRYIRNMKNPSDESVTGGRQPFHFDQYVYGGSVHLNSGIPNRFFYLMAEGNTQYAIGRTKTGIIAFDVLKSLNKDAGFIDFFQAMKAQASSRYGTDSNEVAAVIEAGVGVGFTDKEINKVEVETSYIPETANAVLFLSPNDTSLSLGNYNLNVQFYDSEIPSYSENAVALLSTSAAFSRPSAGVANIEGNNLFYTLYKKTDGSIGFYYYDFISTQEGEEVYLSADSASLFNNISTDRTFTQLASSLTGILANTIQIYDIETSESTFIELYTPSFTEDEKGLPVDLVDVVEFDPTGRFVAFDYLTSAPGGEQFWSIGILEIETGLISYPFAKLPSNISVGYPSFSNINSDIIIFDALFSDSGESAAYIINLKTGNITAVANTKAIQSDSVQYSLPTLTSNDNAAIFSVMNTSGDYVGLMPLNDSYEPDTENFIYLNPVNEAYYLRSIPFSAYQDTLTLNQDETTFDFGDVTVNQSDEICLTNESTHPIKINNAVIDQGVILSALPNYYNGGEKVCASFTIDVDRLALGLFNLGIELTHNGTSEPIIYTFSGNKLLDSDGDGIADVTDTDDDNDGVLDTADAYPLISIGELVDTDSDGAPDTCDTACGDLGMAADSDDDNDGVLDTVDAYPLISIGELIDTDSDGAPDTCDTACSDLGMIEDTDDDNDGIVDTVEIANGLDPLDSADALLDADNDGVSNIDEINAGSDVNSDDQPPVFTSIVEDIEVISTGLATTVELVNPKASDVTSDVVVTNDSDGEFPVGISTVTYTATDVAGNRATLTQQVNVLPYIVISPGKSLGDGQTINVTLSLNGTPAVYPVTGDVTAGGTASSDDFTLSTNTVSITEGLTQTIELTAVDDGVGDSDETIILSLSNVVNAGIKAGSDNEQTFIITEESILPTVSVSVEQNDVIGRMVDKQSEVRFDIDIEDPNGLDSLTVEWSGIEGITEVATSNDLVLDPSALAAGVYVLNLSVTDNDVAGDNIVNQLITIKVIETLPQLTSTDSDGDGVSDIEEGLGDSDNDGIADYLDNTPQINLQPLGDTFAQAQDGVLLALGATALSGDDNSIAIDTTILPEDTSYEYEEVFDFTLSGLALGASYDLVLPLSQAIPENAVYRKLTDNGWVDFVEDTNNAVHSVITTGVCPAIDSDLWVTGLIAGGNCIKLTIQDGSSNDTDGVENGTVEDPSGIAVVKATPAPTPTPTPNPTSPSSGGGSSGGSTTIQILMLLWLAMIIRRLVTQAKY
jgi:Zn-dependent metalloprotease